MKMWKRVCPMFNCACRHIGVLDIPVRITVPLTDEIQVAEGSVLVLTAEVSKPNFAETWYKDAVVNLPKVDNYDVRLNDTIHTLTINDVSP